MGWVLEMVLRWSWISVVEADLLYLLCEGAGHLPGGRNKNGEERITTRAYPSRLVNKC